MHILIVSWRDIANPDSGGAEIYIHQIFKQLARQGHRVTHLSNRFANSSTRSKIDNINYLRIGHRRLPHFFMFFSYNYLVTRFSQLQPDLIINCIHGLPNLTSPYLPLLREHVSAKHPIPATIYLAFELAGPIWFKQTNFPFNIVGYFAEKLYTKLLHDLPFVTISPSQSHLLAKSGITRLNVIPPGVALPSSPKYSQPSKSRQPLFISLSRLAPMKQLDQSIRAFHLFHQRYPQAKFIILGRGSTSHLSYLRSLTTKYGLTDSIQFAGFVSDSTKYQLLAKSWALISTSINEGWGLNVIEAASVGTPTLAYRSPGLIDTVQNRINGLLTNSNQPSEMYRLMVKITRSPHLRKTLGKSARLHARQFTWNRSVTQWHELIDQVTQPWRNEDQ